MEVKSCWKIVPRVRSRSAPRTSKAITSSEGKELAYAADPAIDDRRQADSQK